MQLNLVRMVETNYTETGDTSVTLSRFRGATDGFMDEIHALRNQVYADQVVLISADTSYCGIASVMTNVTTAFASSAFSVVHDDFRFNCLGSNNTLAHELGHNQGNIHDQANSSFAGAYPDSYGYRVCGVFRDIMAYSCQGEVRIPYFSSSDPALTYACQPIGVAGSADTARSMTATAPTVASFRLAPSVTTVPATPEGLTASGTSPCAIDLQWTDKANNETGYKVQRSADGVNWSKRAALGANAASFTDTGLAEGSTWFYRVLTWNSVGNSAARRYRQPDAR